MSFAQAAANARRITINTAKIREAESALETERSVAANDALGPQMPQTYWDKYQAETESFINRSKAAQGVVGGIEVISADDYIGAQSKTNVYAETSKSINKALDAWGNGTFDPDTFYNSLDPEIKRFYKEQEDQTWRTSEDSFRWLSGNARDIAYSLGREDLTSLIDEHGYEIDLDELEYWEEHNPGEPLPDYFNINGNALDYETSGLETMSDEDVSAWHELVREERQSLRDEYNEMRMLHPNATIRYDASTKKLFADYGKSKESYKSATKVGGSKSEDLFSLNI